MDREQCPECGGAYIDGLTCWDQLGAILSWEAQDPALAAVHFLTVACYNLQHPAQFTDVALAGLRTALVDHLQHGTPVTELRRRAGRAYGGSRRVLKPPEERRPILRRWSIPIAEVYAHGEPNAATDRVRAWAARLLSEC